MLEQHRGEWAMEAREKGELVMMMEEDELSWAEPRSPARLFALTQVPSQSVVESRRTV